jgi:WD40 repeat protein
MILNDRPQLKAFKPTIMKTKLFFIILAFGSLFLSCKKDGKIVNDFQPGADTTVFIHAPVDSTIVYDTVPIQFSINENLNIVRTECYVDFNLLEGFDAIPAKINFYASDFELGSFHNYQLKVIAKDGKIYNSNIVTLIIGKLSKPVPEVVFISKTSLQLNWLDESNDETGYHVFRKEDNNDSLLIASLPENSSSFTDYTVDTTKNYVYWIGVYSSREKFVSDSVSIRFELNKYMPFRNFSIDESFDGKIALTPDGKRAVLTYYFKNNFIVLDLNNGTKSYLSHFGGTLGLAMSHNGNFFVTGGIPMIPDVAKIWNLNTLTQISEINLNDPTGFALCINKTDEHLVIGGDPMRIFNISDGTLIKTFTIEEETFVRAVTYSSDETVILSGGNDALVKLWDVSTGNLFRTFTGHTANVGSACYNPDESQIYSGSYQDNTLRIWTTETGQLLKTITRDASIVAIQVKNDGVVIVAEKDGSLFIMTPEGQIGQEFGYPTLMIHMDYGSSQDVIAAYTTTSVDLYKKIGHWERL